jgi:hypothetical protein
VVVRNENAHATIVECDHDVVQRSGR